MTMKRRESYSMYMTFLFLIHYKFQRNREMPVLYDEGYKCFLAVLEKFIMKRKCSMKK